MADDEAMTGLFEAYRSDEDEDIGGGEEEGTYVSPLTYSAFGGSYFANFCLPSACRLCLMSFSMVFLDFRANASREPSSVQDFLEHLGTRAQKSTNQIKKIYCQPC